MRAFDKASDWVGGRRSGGAARLTKPTAKKPLRSRAIADGAAAARDARKVAETLRGINDANAQLHGRAVTAVRGTKGPVTPAEINRINSEHYRGDRS